MQWVLTHPARLLLEQTQIAALCEELPGLTTHWQVDADMSVRVDFDLQIGEERYEGRITYPDVFPNSPPYIRPRDGRSRWTPHQFGDGGSLCLEWRTDNWRPEVTAADMLRSAHALLSTEQGEQAPPAAVPDAHQVTRGQNLRGEIARFVLTDQLLREFRKLPQGASAGLKTRTVFTSLTDVAFVSEMEGVGTDGKIAGLPSGIKMYFPLCAVAGTGRVFRTDQFDALPLPATLEELTVLLLKVGYDPALVASTEAEPNKAVLGRVVLLGGLNVHVYSLENGSPVKLVKNAVIFDESNNRSDPEAEALRTLRVGVVGLGSIGSKVAVSLARSGVRRFVLVDDDILVPGNVVRNELTWAAVGAHKAHAVEDQIKLVAADVDVSVELHRIAGQESSLNGATLMKRLAECDLIVDATANPNVFLRLAAIARQAKVSMAWGEVFATGYGGLIARARPDLDPNPLAVRDSWHRYLATQPPPPFPHANDYDGAGDMVGDMALTAYDSDVGFIAAALTRLALDTALRRTPSHYPVPLYMIGMRKEWIFREPFDVQPVEASGPDWQSDVEPADPEVIKKALHALQKMMPELPDADRTDTATGT